MQFITHANNEQAPYPSPEGKGLAEHYFLSSLKNWYFNAKIIKPKKCKSAAVAALSYKNSIIKA